MMPWFPVMASQLGDEAHFDRRQHQRPRPRIQRFTTAMMSRSSNFPHSGHGTNFQWCQQLFIFPKAIVFVVNGRFHSDNLPIFGIYQQLLKGNWRWNLLMYGSLTVEFYHRPWGFRFPFVDKPSGAGHGREAAGNAKMVGRNQLGTGSEHLCTSL